MEEENKNETPPHSLIARGNEAVVAVRRWDGRYGDRIGGR